MVSVTELHLCYLCPRLLFFHYKDQKKGKSVFEHIGCRSGDLQGTILHDILEEVHSDLAGKGDEEMHNKLLEALLNQERDMQFHSHILNHYVLKNRQKIKTTGLFPLQDALQIWEKELFSCIDREMNHCNTSDRRNITQIFQSSKRTLIYNEGGLRIRGEPDAVFFDSVAGSYVIWEFKGMKDANRERVLMQVALYAWLLKKEIGIPSRGTIFLFENENPIQHCSLDAISAKIAELPSLFKIYHQVIAAVHNDYMNTLPLTRDRSVCAQCPISCVKVM